MGALILQPGLIRAFAQDHPPAWFLDDAALEMMQALYCLSFLGRDLRIDDLVDALDRHGALDDAGGREAVEALVAPRAELEAAQGELQALRVRLPTAEQERLDREEALASLDELLAAADGAAPVAAPSLVDEPAPQQLELFLAPVARRPEDDR